MARLPKTKAGLIRLCRIGSNPDALMALGEMNLKEGDLQAAEGCFFAAMTENFPGARERHQQIREAKSKLLDQFSELKSETAMMLAKDIPYETALTWREALCHIVEQAVYAGRRLRNNIPNQP